MWVKSHGEIPVLWRKAGAGEVPPFAGRKLESGEWWNKKSNTRMEGLIGLVWPLEVRKGTEAGLERIGFVSNLPSKAGILWTLWDELESGSLKLRGARPVMMKQGFSTHFNSALLGCSNICAGWDFSSSPLAEALSPWAREACLSLLPSPCCSLSPALPKALGWVSSLRCQPWVPCCLQECPPYWRDSGVRGKFTWAPFNEIFTSFFKNLETRRQISLEQQNCGDIFIFHKLLLRNYSSMGFILCNL